MGIWVQGYVSKTMVSALQPYTLNHMANIADDFVGWVDHELVAGKPVIDWTGMADPYADFLKLCDEHK